MKVLKIISLRMQDFKGISAMVLDVDGKSACVSGENGTGKTTIYDAWAWLITGKDSIGRMPDDNRGFSIKPLDINGEVADRSARTIVEAVVDLDGDRITLRKEYAERWSKKRGALEASYDGNTTEFYVNDVPCGKREYEERLDEMVPADMFQLLSSPMAFPALGDNKRRAILFEMADLGDERGLMLREPRFAPLYEATVKASVEDYQRQIVAKRKRLNKERETLPARIDENRQIADGLRGIDFDALRAESEALSAGLRTLDAALSGQNSDTREMELQAEVLEHNIAALDAENRAHRAAQTAARPDKGAVSTEIKRLKLAFAYESERYHRSKNDMERANASAEQCRNEWRRVKAEPYAGDAVCPACGQLLPPSKQADARAVWENHRDRRLQTIMEEGQRQSKAAEYYAKQMESQKERMIALESQIAEATDRLAALEAAPVIEITDLPDYSARRAALAQERETIVQAVEQAKEKARASASELWSSRKETAEQLEMVNAQLKQEAVLELTGKREQELRAQLQEITSQMEDVDAMLDLIDNFARYKAAAITDSINSLFRMAEFRLFRTQVNGGLVPCCDILSGGVPYNTGLNTGAKINVGMDILRTLSRHYGVSVPVFVDNAESVTHLIDSGSQLIRLEVKPGHNLEMEVEK